MAYYEAYGQEYPGESCQEELGRPPCEGPYEMPPETYRKQESRMLPRLPQGQVVKLFCKSNPDYSLGVRDGQVMLVYYNPSDPTQQWIKDDSWSNRVRDAVGHPSFCLVNKATGQALRHAQAACQEVLLARYEAGSFDEDVMWTESEDMGYGFRTIRMANNIGLNLDAFQGDRKHGGIREGTRAVLWTWNKQDNQRAGFYYTERT